MENYFEYSALGNGGKKKRLLYILCWAVMISLALAAVILCSNVLVAGADHLSVNWLNLILVVLFLAAAVFLFRRKDHLCVEYDYFLFGDTLEVTAVLNRRRRRRMAEIQMERVQRAGSIQAVEAGKIMEKPHAWYVDSEKTLTYLIYMEGNVRHAALLELNDAFIEGMRKRLPMGAWQNGEGKY